MTFANAGAGEGPESRIERDGPAARSEADAGQGAAKEPVRLRSATGLDSSKTHRRLPQRPVTAVSGCVRDERFCAALRALGVPVEKGEFGARMEVSS